MLLLNIYIYIILCDIILCYIKLYIILYYIVLYYIVLYCYIKYDLYMLNIPQYCLINQGNAPKWGM